MKMKDYFADLYNDNEESEEPSFSLYDFKQWLGKQKDTEKSITEARQIQEEKVSKEDLKQKFKERVKNKIKKKKD